MEEIRKLYPFPLTPTEETTPWGSETYCLADLGFADSAVASGWLEGNRLGELMETFLERISGDGVFYYFGRQFPLLVKVLKTTGETPVIVCPDDGIASQRYDSLGKKKFWYVASAEPGSSVGIGFRRDMDAAGLYDGCTDGSVRNFLMTRPVKAGDHFLIAPGVVHAASAGLEIVEISEASGLDFNIFSPYGNDLQGITDSLDFIRLEAGVPEPAPVTQDSADGPAKKLVSEEEFILSRIALSAPVRIGQGESGTFLVYTALGGEAVIRPEGEGENCPLRRGMAVLVPADVKAFTLVPLVEGTVLLEATLERTIANN